MPAEDRVDSEHALSQRAVVSPKALELLAGLADARSDYRPRISYSCSALRDVSLSANTHAAVTRAVPMT